VEAGPRSVWQVEVDRAAPADWSFMLDLFDDANIYQTWAYGSVRWGRKNLSQLVLKRDSEVAGIAQLRIVRPTRLKFGMAYLRWGPICQRRVGGLERRVLLRMAEALHQEYVVNRGLLLQIIPNAFVGSPRAKLFQSALSDFAQQPSTSAATYRTFVLDLVPSLEELRRDLDKKWRNQLTRSEKNGLTVIAGSGVEEYSRFCEIYSQMRNRKTFETTVDTEEFERIQENLTGKHRMRVLICEQDGRPVAGIVVSAMGDSAIYLLGATSDDGLDAKGSYLLQWAAIQWLKENGVRYYDLGGIDPEGNPGVYHFKRGLSGADVYQLAPLVACNNFFSFAAVKASLAVSRTIRSFSASKQRRAVKSTA